MDHTGGDLALSPNSGQAGECCLDILRKFMLTIICGTGNNDVCRLIRKSGTDQHTM